MVCPSIQNACTRFAVQTETIRNHTRLTWNLEGWRGCEDGTGSGSCPVASFGISGVY